MGRRKVIFLHPILLARNPKLVSLLAAYRHTQNGTQGKHFSLHGSFTWRLILSIALVGKVRSLETNKEEKTNDTDVCDGRKTS